jgi:hypothetical protein
MGQSACELQDEVKDLEVYIGQVDKGTTNSQFSIFDKTEHGLGQKKHRQIFPPKLGWIKHDPEEIWQNTRHIIKGALAKGKTSGGGNCLQCHRLAVYQHPHEIYQNLIADRGTNRFWDGKNEFSMVNGYGK